MSIDFAAILRDHRSLIQIRQAKACTCGWEDGFVPDATEAHTAHLAAVLQAAVREAAAPLIERWEDGSVNDHAQPCLDLEDCALCCAQDLRALVGVEQ